MNLNCSHRIPLNCDALWSDKNWTFVFGTFNETLRFRFKWILMIQCKVVYDYHLCCMEISCTLHFHKKVTLFIHLVSVFVWNLSHFFWTRLLSFVSRLISLLLFAVVSISVKTKCSNDHRHHHYVFVIISNFEYVHFYSRGRSENHVYKYTRRHTHTMHVRHLYLHFDRTLFALFIHCAFRFRWNFNTLSAGQKIVFLILHSYASFPIPCCCSTEHLSTGNWAKSSNISYHIWMILGWNRLID